VRSMLCVHMYAFVHFSACLRTLVAFFSMCESMPDFGNLHTFANLLRPTEHFFSFIISISFFSLFLLLCLVGGERKICEDLKCAAPSEGIKTTALHTLVKTPRELSTILEQIGTTPFPNLAQQ